jgi:hypothetical protein
MVTGKLAPVYEGRRGLGGSRVNNFTYVVSVNPYSVLGVWSGCGSRLCPFDTFICLRLLAQCVHIVAVREGQACNL